jgi:uncharacterized protein YodC (DUF2158 family)
MAEEIRVGDHVQLQTGGPIMTVNKLWSERGLMMARCDWVERGRRQGGSVATTSLKHAEAREIPSSMGQDAVGTLQR